MYQPYPQGGETPPEPSRPTIPSPVRTAVMLMYAGAALSAVGLVVTLFSFHAIERIIRNAPSATVLTQHQVHTIAIATVTIGVVEGLIAIGLWLLMAWANKNGKNWGPDHRHGPVRPEHPFPAARLHPGARLHQRGVLGAGLAGRPGRDRGAVAQGVQPVLRRRQPAALGGDTA
jgi:hypothetical protein